jgi:hypothetical protein
LAAFVGALALVLSGCVRVHWTRATDWGTFTEVPVSNAVNTVTRSVDTAAGLGRLTAAGTEGNDRRFYLALREASTDSEITALWHGHSLQQAGGGQLGVVLRAQLLPDGRVTGYVVWHDWGFGQDQNMYVAVWTSEAGAGPNLQISGIGTAAFDGLTDTVDVSDATRTDGTVTARVPAGHGVKVGDRLVVSLADATFSGVHDVVAVGDTWVRYAAAGSDATSGGGTLRDLDQVMPYWVHAKVVGTTLSVKVWRDGRPEPAWGDPEWSRTFTDTTGVGPVGPGYDGIYAGHTSAGGYVEYGSVEIFSLD